LTRCYNDRMKKSTLQEDSHSVAPWHICVTLASFQTSAAKLQLMGTTLVGG